MCCHATWGLVLQQCVVSPEQPFSLSLPSIPLNPVLNNGSNVAHFHHK